MAAPQPSRVLSEPATHDACAQDYGTSKERAVRADDADVQSYNTKKKAEETVRTDGRRFA